MSGIKDDISTTPFDPDAQTYAHRPKPFGQEVTYRLDPAHLFVDTGRKQERIGYAQIAAAWLSYRPANVTSQGFRTVLRLRDGRTLTLGNLSWKTYFEAERKDAAYRAFVGALLARVAQANPALVCMAGRPGWLWALSTIAGLMMTGGIAATLVWSLFHGSWTLAGLSALFLVPLVHQAWGMASRNRPAAFSAGAIPAGVLPKPV